VNGIISPRSQPVARGLLAAALVVVAIGGSTVISSRPTAESSTQPNFLLPWQDGQTWLTGAAGFHATNDAIDFFPPDTPLSGTIKCEGDPDWEFQESSYYALSSAAGEVIEASNAMVLIDHGGGWLSRHYHMTGFVVESGDYVSQGQRLARPSTLGFCSSGPHNHFWVQGPDGQTSRDVTLSGIPTTEIDTNEYISDTGNFEASGGATPTTQPPPAPTEGPTPSPANSPAATPLPLLRGDVNCDYKVNTLDAMAFLRLIEEPEPEVCNVVTADADCDGGITSADALAVLHHVSGVKALPTAPCGDLPVAPLIPTDTPAPTEPPAPPTSGGDGSG
jgi:hypothetical protein